MEDPRETIIIIKIKVTYIHAISMLIILYYLYILF